MKFSKIAVTSLFFLATMLEAYRINTPVCREEKSIEEKEAFETKCTQKFRTVCIDKPVRRCDKHWETQDDGIKVWVENPATCKNLEQTVCEEVPYDDCQEIHKLVSHQVIKYKPISSVPCFSRIGVDKYGIPAVEIAFPDGTTDRLNIGRFNNQEGRYLGYLESDKARVSMTTHEDHQQLTVMSSRCAESKSNIFKWYRNGTVESVPGPFSNGAYDKLLQRLNQKYLEIIGNRRGGSRTVEPVPYPKTMELKIKVGYVDSFLELKNNNKLAVKKEWDDLHNIVQMMYCPSEDISGLGDVQGDGSLGTTIKITPVSDPVHYPNKRLTANCHDDNCRSSDLDIMEVITKDEFEKDKEDGLDLMVYLAHDEENTGGIGLAQPNVVCDPNPQARAFASSANEYDKNTHVFAATVAHEIGHNLGMAHDFASDPHGGDDEPFDGNQNGNQCEHDDHIMSYGKTPTIWSDCSVRDFAKHYNDIKNRGLDWCMPEVPGNSLTETLEDICMGKKDNTDSAQVVTGATLADLAALGFGHQLAWLLDCEASLGFHSGTTSPVACAALSVVGILG